MIQKDPDITGELEILSKRNYVLEFIVTFEKHNQCNKAVRTLNSHLDRCMMCVFQELCSEINNVVKRKPDEDETEDKVTWRPFRLFPVLTPEQALINVPRPPGSLDKARRLAQLSYPYNQIITSFQEMVHPPNPWNMFGVQGQVLVTFMFKYGRNVIGHSVHIQVRINMSI